MNTNRLWKGLAALALVSVLSQSAGAQSHRNNIGTRLSEQEARIRQGVASGQLTRQEAARLRERDIAIRFDAAHARITGGHMTAAERARLEEKLNRSSKAIYNQKHDKQHRW